MTEDNKTKKAQTGDRIFRLIATICAMMAFVIIIGIFLSLIHGSELSLRKFGVRFLISQAWNPVTGEFGALSSIYGTLMSTLIAMVIAVPMSLVIALFL